MTRWTEADLQNHMAKSVPKSGKAPSFGLVKGKYLYYIGIDCGVDTGFAGWNAKNKAFEWVDTVRIHQAMRRSEQWLNLFRKDGVFFRVEDARLRKRIPWQKTEKDERGKREGAGSVKRDAIVWEDFLTELGADFEMVAPKDNKTKMDSAYFARITGWTARTTNHGRDAANLVHAY